MSALLFLVAAGIGSVAVAKGWALVADIRRTQRALEREQDR